MDSKMRLEISSRELRKRKKIMKVAHLEVSSEEGNGTGILLVE